MNTIYLIGDSTCQTNFEDTYPQIGWGQVFPNYVKDNYKVINLAKNGRSTKSFTDEGLFNPCKDNIEKGDYLFIEFGHNDEKKEDPTRFTEPFGKYQENLLYFINTARKVGATPILLSPIYRRHFDENGKIKDNVHLNYPEAVRQLAEKEHVIYIDMCELTKGYLSKLGDEASKELFMNFAPGLYPNYPEGKNDNTHFREKGAKMVCDILTQELKKNEVTSILLK